MCPWSEVLFIIYNITDITECYKIKVITTVIASPVGSCTAVGFASVFSVLKPPHLPTTSGQLDKVCTYNLCAVCYATSSCYIIFFLMLPSTNIVHLYIMSFFFFSVSFNIVFDLQFFFILILNLYLYIEWSSSSYNWYYKLYYVFVSKP